jgi:hypothetical protein
MEMMWCSVGRWITSSTEWQTLTLTFGSLETRVFLLCKSVMSLLVFSVKLKRSGYHVCPDVPAKVLWLYSQKFRFVYRCGFYFKVLVLSWRGQLILAWIQLCRNVSSESCDVKDGWQSLPLEADTCSLDNLPLFLIHGLHDFFRSIDCLKSSIVKDSIKEYSSAIKHRQEGFSYQSETCDFLSGWSDRLSS